MNEKNLPFERPKPELDIPLAELEIIQTPTKDTTPEVIKIINPENFDIDYPPLPSERERDSIKKPTIN